jgi:hypothetical protein
MSRGILTNFEEWTKKHSPSLEPLKLHKDMITKIRSWKPDTIISSRVLRTNLKELDYRNGEYE